jgi:hypothetical protein
MTPRRLANILGGLMVVALAIAARPALACGPENALVCPALARSASLRALPASMVATTRHPRSLHHRHHLGAHRTSLTRDLSASGPASLPAHPGGLPHSGRAATAHHAPTVMVRQGKGSSRTASFLAERFAWGADRLSFALGQVERGIPKNQTFDVNAGRGPPRAGPTGDSGFSAALAFPASIYEHPDYPANQTKDFSSARRFDAPSSVAAVAFREPAPQAVSLGERCRMNWSRLTPSPVVAAWEARRIA